MRATRYLWINNVSNQINDDNFTSVFQNYGKVQSVHIHENNGNRNAVVAFMDITSATKALESGIKVDDVILDMEYCESTGLSRNHSNAMPNEIKNLSMGVSPLPTTPNRSFAKCNSVHETIPTPITKIKKSNKRLNYSRKKHRSRSTSVVSSKSNSSSITDVAVKSKQKKKAKNQDICGPPENISFPHDMNQRKKQRHLSTNRKKMKGEIPDTTTNFVNDATSSLNDPSFKKSASLIVQPLKHRHIQSKHGEKIKHQSRRQRIAGVQSPSTNSLEKDDFVLEKRLSKDMSETDNNFDCVAMEDSPFPRPVSKKIRDELKSHSRSRSCSKNRVNNSSWMSPEHNNDPFNNNNSYAGSTCSNDESNPGSFMGVPFNKDEFNTRRNSILCDEENLLRGLKVTSLPMRSTDSSIRDGLFHEYKKYGKITSVIVQGSGTNRHAVITFQKVEDAFKAQEGSREKIFFATPINVELHEGYDVEDADLCPPEHVLDEYHPKATKTLFVGNLIADIVTEDDIFQAFQRFGEIVDIDIKSQAIQSGYSYAFVQFIDIKSVVRALNTPDVVRINSKNVKTGFGKSQPTDCVWMDNLAPTINDIYLTKQLKRFGRVMDVFLDRIKMQALIFFDCFESAHKAIMELKNRALAGRKVQVDYANQEYQAVFIESYRQLPHNHGPKAVRRGGFHQSFNSHHQSQASNLHQRDESTSITNKHELGGYQDSLTGNYDNYNHNNKPWFTHYNNRKGGFMNKPTGSRDYKYYSDHWSSHEKSSEYLGDRNKRHGDGNRSYDDYNFYHNNDSEYTSRRHLSEDNGGDSRDYQDSKSTETFSRYADETTHTTSGGTKFDTLRDRGVHPFHSGSHSMLSTPQHFRRSYERDNFNLNRKDTYYHSPRILHLRGSKSRSSHIEGHKFSNKHKEHLSYSNEFVEECSDVPYDTVVKPVESSISIKRSLSPISQPQTLREKQLSLSELETEKKPVESLTVLERERHLLLAELSQLEKNKVSLASKSDEIDNLDQKKSKVDPKSSNMDENRRINTKIDHKECINSERNVGSSTHAGIYTFDQESNRQSCDIDADTNNNFERLANNLSLNNRYNLTRDQPDSTKSLVSSTTPGYSASKTSFRPSGLHLVSHNSQLTCSLTNNGVSDIPTIFPPFNVPPPVLSQPPNNYTAVGSRFESPSSSSRDPRLNSQHYQTLQQNIPSLNGACDPVLLSQLLQEVVKKALPHAMTPYVQQQVISAAADAARASCSMTDMKTNGLKHQQSSFTQQIPSSTSFPKQHTDVHHDYNDLLPKELFSLEERIRMLDAKINHNEKIRPIVPNSDYSKFKIRKKNEVTSNFDDANSCKPHISVASSSVYHSNSAQLSYKTEPIQFGKNALVNPKIYSSTQTSSVSHCSASNSKTTSSLTNSNFMNNKVEESRLPCSRYNIQTLDLNKTTTANSEMKSIDSSIRSILKKEVTSGPTTSTHTLYNARTCQYQSPNTPESFLLGGLPVSSSPSLVCKNIENSPPISTPSGSITPIMSPGANSLTAKNSASRPSYANDKVRQIKREYADTNSHSISEISKKSDTAATNIDTLSFSKKRKHLSNQDIPKKKVKKSHAAFDDSIFDPNSFRFNKKKSKQTISHNDVIISESQPVNTKASKPKKEKLRKSSKSSKFESNTKTEELSSNDYEPKTTQCKSLECPETTQNICHTNSKINKKKCVSNNKKLKIKLLRKNDELKADKSSPKEFKHKIKRLKENGLKKRRISSKSMDGDEENSGADPFDSDESDIKVNGLNSYESMYDKIKRRASKDSSRRMQYDSSDHAFIHKKKKSKNENPSDAECEMDDSAKSIESNVSKKNKQVPKIKQKRLTKRISNSHSQENDELSDNSDLENIKSSSVSRCKKRVPKKSNNSQTFDESKHVKVTIPKKIKSQKSRNRPENGKKIITNRRLSESSLESSPISSHFSPNNSSDESKTTPSTERMENSDTEMSTTVKRLVPPHWKPRHRFSRSPHDYNAFQINANDYISCNTGGLNLDQSNLMPPNLLNKCSPIQVPIMYDMSSNKDVSIEPDVIEETIVYDNVEIPVFEETVSATKVEVCSPCHNVIVKHVSPKKETFNKTAAKCNEKCLESDVSVSSPCSSLKSSIVTNITGENELQKCDTSSEIPDYIQNSKLNSQYIIEEVKPQKHHETELYMHQSFKARYKKSSGDNFIHEPEHFQSLHDATSMTVNYLISNSVKESPYQVKLAESNTFDVNSLIYHYDNSSPKSKVIYPNPQVDSTPDDREQQSKDLLKFAKQITKTNNSEKLTTDSQHEVSEIKREKNIDSSFSETVDLDQSSYVHHKHIENMNANNNILKKEGTDTDKSEIIDSISQVIEDVRKGNFNAEIYMKNWASDTESMMNALNNSDTEVNESQITDQVVNSQCYSPTKDLTVLQPSNRLSSLSEKCSPTKEICIEKECNPYPANQNDKVHLGMVSPSQPFAEIDIPKVLNEQAITIERIPNPVYCHVYPSESGNASTSNIETPASQPSQSNNSGAHPNSSIIHSTSSFSVHTPPRPFCSNTNVASLSNMSNIGSSTYGIQNFPQTAVQSSIQQPYDMYMYNMNQVVLPGTPNINESSYSTHSVNTEYFSSPQQQTVVCESFLKQLNDNDPAEPNLSAEHSSVNLFPVSVSSVTVSPAGSSQQISKIPQQQSSSSSSMYNQLDQFKDGMILLGREYPLMWQGSLALKNENALIQMHLVHGNHTLIQACMSLAVAIDQESTYGTSSTSKSGWSTLRIVQRMRMEPTQLDGVDHKMRVDAEYCMCLALASGTDHTELVKTNAILRDSFIGYMQDKSAAGIINVHHPDSLHGLYVMHIFPPCAFSHAQMRNCAPELLHWISLHDVPHLLVVITTV